MLRGDISNKSAPILAFNIDNLLFEEHKEKYSIINTLKKKLTSDKKQFFDREINKVIVTTLNRIWTRYNFSIYFVTMYPEYKDDYYNILDKNGVNYTSLVSFNSREDLRETSLLQYTYYFDNDFELISFVGAKAQHIEELQNILK